ncbi:hypothetical protein E2C01_074470 [Portunus trituberculatus]|uniref:Immunoglobulin I-set domain-containing protein n=1 Tax=Portunus trituberculatus TaxID=210409 RepID=A0A5B7IC78_PORTR|nr:hypothetical protein [Portunus trituberculatus]
MLPTGVQQVESEELVLKSVTRKDMGAYLCIATNKVPPSISKRIVLDVHLFLLLSWCYLIVKLFDGKA